MPSGPAMNVEPPPGKSRSAWRLKQVVPPWTSLDKTVTQRLILAMLVGVLCTLSPVLNVKLDPTCSGTRLPTSIEAPAGTDPYTTLGTVMQSTLGSVDCRMKLTPVRA